MNPKGAGRNVFMGLVGDSRQTTRGLIGADVRAAISDVEELWSIYSANGKTFMLFRQLFAEWPRGASVVAQSDGYYSFLPGPRRARPGLLPVCSPSFSTCWPLTKTCFIPVAYWCGFSKVAWSAIVAGSKTTTSANIPS